MSNLIQISLPYGVFSKTLEKYFRIGPRNVMNFNENFSLKISNHDVCILNLFFDKHFKPEVMNLHY